MKTRPRALVAGDEIIEAPMTPCGGGVYCGTTDIRREGTLQSHFPQVG